MMPPTRPPSVPSHWDWALCAGCKQIAWYDPNVKVAVEAAGKTFYVTCGAKCARVVIQRL